MNDFPIEKYKFYKYSNSIVAISTYAGKEVKGKAHCDPNDVYNEESGRELAAARCNLKIACKREKRAKQKMEAAQSALLEAKKHYEEMCKYYFDSCVRVDAAAQKLEMICKKL